MMNKLLLAAALTGIAATALADESVDGYYRSDGVYVAPYQRSTPNTYQFDNYNAQGNRNPYTGKQGTQPHEFSYPYQPVKPYQPPKASGR